MTIQTAEKAAALSRITSQMKDSSDRERIVRILQAIDMCPALISDFDEDTIYDMEDAGLIEEETGELTLKARALLH